MGIQGLLPFLKKIHQPVNISQFHGCTVAIDAYCWLHKGAFSCAEKLALKEDTNQFVYYCMKYIDYMLRKDIKPIMVFDGCHLESKANVEKTRRERRELHRKRAAQFLREGKRSEAKECLQRCIDITPQMALKLIQACRDKGVDCIVAPYEADAQLAYLNLSGIAQVIVTEDSDLLLFGCEKIIFKMDFFGNGTLIEQARLNEVMAVQNGFYTFEKFRYMCILSGCDYLPSLTGIGLAKSNKVFKLARQGDIRQLLKKLPTYLKMNIAVGDEYVEGFIKADNTFLYQLVFDPLNRELKPLNPYPPELQGVDLNYAGHQISRQMAYQIALGNIDIHTHEYMADFDPDTFVAKHPFTAKQRYHLSIWDKNYAVKSGSPCKEIQPSALIDTNDNEMLARGRTAGKTRIIKLSRETDKHQNPVLKVNEVTEVYETTHVSPKKVGKKRLFDSINDDLEEVPLDKKPDHNNSVINSDNDEFFSDENDSSHPKKKQSKIKESPKFMYNAANIGEETFKEESIPQSKDTDKKENCAKSRNIFAVTKTTKSNLDVKPPVETKSKYFPSASLKSCATNQSKDNQLTSDKAHNSDLLKNSGNVSTDLSKKETLKPLSLKDMFRNLKEKKSLQGDNENDSNRNIENTISNRKHDIQKSRTPSAFCWSKFKSSSSTSKDSTKAEKSHLNVRPGSKFNKQDSFSEMLSRNDISLPNCTGDASANISDSSCSSLKQHSERRNDSSLLKNNEESVVKELRTESYASFLKNNEQSEVKELKTESYASFLKNNEQSEVKELKTESYASFLKNNEQSEVKELRTESYASFLKNNEQSEVKELRTESYASFLKSMVSVSDKDDNNDLIDPPVAEDICQSGHNEESPFPGDDKDNKMTEQAFVENDRIDCSSQNVIDLTDDFSQASTSRRTSDVSKSSNSSGRSSCRVSGLTKRREKPGEKPGKKMGKVKSDSNQKSIKDLFSKFAFKRENDSGLTKNPSECTIDLPDDSEDEDQQFTPRVKPLDTDAALVRRRLKL